jgi:hypothetical protein
MSTEDLIDIVCKKCRYYQKGCTFDKGDSLTKIPCQALVELTKNEDLQAMVKVQNYILEHMQMGDTTINVQKAAQELGLTPPKLLLIYCILSRRGWFKKVSKETREVPSGLAPKYDKRGMPKKD